MERVTLEQRHRQLLDYWSSLIEPGQDIPDRCKFDPSAIPKLLSFLVLSDIKDDTVLFRVVGTEMAEAWGDDFTGKTLDEIASGPYRDFIHDLFMYCVVSRSPIICRNRFQYDRGRMLDTCQMMLPFSAKGDPKRVGHVLVGQSFDFNKTGPAKPQVACLSNGAFVAPEPKFLPHLP